MCQKHKKNNIKKGYGFGFRYINDCAYTLLALSPLRSSQLIKQNNKNPRIFTERECARLQGFPENFIIHPNTNIAYKQFGNSITVNVLESIFKNLIII
jgi:DNA (cytosine-5)-methyltransferase 1